MPRQEPPSADSSPREDPVLVVSLLGSGIAFLDGTVVNVDIFLLFRGTDLDAGVLRRAAGRRGASPRSGRSLIGGSVVKISAAAASTLLASPVSGSRRGVRVSSGRRRRSLLARAAGDVRARCWSRARWGSSSPIFQRAPACCGDRDVDRVDGVAIAVGPLPGGAPVQAASWRWIVAIGLVLAVAATPSSSRPARDRPRRSSGPGRLEEPALVALSLAGLVFASSSSPAAGWGTCHLGPWWAGASLRGFAVVELRCASRWSRFRPVQPANFAWGNLATPSDLRRAGQPLPHHRAILPAGVRSRHRGRRWGVDPVTR